MPDTNYVILGRRWYDGSNTYHSVEVWKIGKDGKEWVGREPFAAGYDDQYITSAFKLLQKDGEFPTTGERLTSGFDSDEYDFLTLRRNEPDRFIIECFDVSRKKDL